MRVPLIVTALFVSPSERLPDTSSLTEGFASVSFNSILIGVAM